MLDDVPGLSWETAFAVLQRFLYVLFCGCSRNQYVFALSMQMPLSLLCALCRLHFAFCILQFGIVCRILHFAFASTCFRVFSIFSVHLISCRSFLFFCFCLRPTPFCDAGTSTYPQQQYHCSARCDRHCWSQNCQWICCSGTQSCGRQVRCSSGHGTDP